MSSRKGVNKMFYSKIKNPPKGSGHFVTIEDASNKIMTPKEAYETYRIKIDTEVEGLGFTLVFGDNEYGTSWFMDNPEEIKRLLEVTESETIKQLNGKSVEAFMAGWNVIGLNL